MSPHLRGGAHIDFCEDHVGFGFKLEVVASFCYLGDMLSAASGCELSTTCENHLEEVQGAATSSLFLQHLFQEHGRVYSSCVQSAMLYASETWPLVQSDQSLTYKLMESMGLGGPR